jgi:DNA-binding MarR family transcriptional regulator
MAKAHDHPLEGQLSYWLRFLSSRSDRALAAKLAEHKISTTEWLLLRDLQEYDGLVPSVIAKRLGITRGAVSKLVDRLEARHLVAQYDSETDDLYQVIALGEKGEDLAVELVALADRHEAEFFGHLKRADRDLLLTTLRDIAQRNELEAPPID